MSKQKQIDDFLDPGIQQVRHSIKDIDDSYNHEWDILAELCQNAVDAIREADQDEGEINLVVDASRNKVSIYDDGVGISPERLPKLLGPFSTDK
jgi:molecular chaperone HtpG